MSENKIDAILDELVRIRRTLEFMVEDRFKIYLSEVASTTERKQIWILLDGAKTTAEIADKLKITQRSVQRFLKQLSGHNLIDTKRRGYPRRKIDYIPQEWISSD
ncbi:MAG: hypothetical protein AM325_011060 [Candidatus Thorarchaeota archaeon SMTZ1-45]|nr:MAG: hypothetical protein AM325_12760 [Candidatus Thorarchaeota archaeon SMTZ1-45]